MTGRRTMTYEDAVGRLPERDLPAFWVGDAGEINERLASVERGSVSRLAESPGGRPIDLVTYGDREGIEGRANFNSAVGARDVTHYVDRAERERPVVMLIGPVHGAETEGLTGLLNLIEIMETGSDLRRRSHPKLRELGSQCRLLLVPNGNPDGLARVEPATLNGLTRADLRFWGQGTWADDTLMEWPDCKKQHPMTGENVGFLGGYFDDDGVNPMHDEFFDPMGPEAPAFLQLARAEAPDVAVSLHSYAPAPGILRPAYLPTDAQRDVQSIHREYTELLADAGLPHEDVFEVSSEDGSPPPHFTLVSALYHVSGARSFVHETPHGLADDDACQVSLEEILDVQLNLYEAIFEYCLPGA
jgi:hypothetical protein